MSAFIVGNESINKIVNSFYWRTNNEFLKSKLKDKFGLSFEGLDDNDLNEELRKFGQLLVDLNNNSVNQRYGEQSEPIKFEYSDCATEQTQHKNIYQFLKSVECLTYQSCEGDCDETEIYKFLQELENSLRYEIINEIEEYKNARWE